MAKNGHVLSMAAVRPSRSIVSGAGVAVPPRELHPCGRCATAYDTHKRLLEHLYWRHGTESRACARCGLRKWSYAAHVCHVVPVEVVLEDYPSPGPGPGPGAALPDDTYCCGRHLHDVPMIACDGPSCPVQWYHFQCVGVSTPPEGDWFCPQCWDKLNCHILVPNI